MSGSLRNIVLFLLVAGCLPGDTSGQASPCRQETGGTGDRSLQFPAGRPFRIVQFTDIHLKPDRKKETGNTIELIENILDTQHPDLVVFTGDLVIVSPQEEGWKLLSEPLVSRRIPWAAALGNHDGEHDLSRHGLIDLLISIPFSMNSHNETPMQGAGNGCILLTSSGNTGVAAVLWLIDTNDYPEQWSISKYDWVGLEQIMWFREKSRALNENGTLKPLPSLAFIHIPLPEYRGIPGSGTMRGHHGEEISPPGINSGLFAQMVIDGGVMGVFAGHDHNNDFTGTRNGICLAYGRVSGFSAYGKLNRGARVIDLYEGQYRFDTYTCTPERKGDVYSYPTEFEGAGTMKYLKATGVPEGLQPGLQYRYFEGIFKSTGELGSKKALKTGILENISLSPAERNDHWGMAFEGWIKTDHTGPYRFFTRSDDGSMLYIDDVPVVRNEGSHSKRLQFGIIRLEKGFHRFRLLYFQNYMGQFLQTGYSSPWFRESEFPSGVFFH